MQFSRRDFLRVSSAAAFASRLPRLLASDAASEALCRKLASDPLRPQYHLIPAHNWMNDPNGPIFFRGKYHMFHQYNPQGAVWGNMHWAHATSPDMIHWQHEGIALAPTPGGPDQDGVFSGSAVLDNGRPTVIYTGVAPPASPAEATLRDGQHVWRETQCLAVAQDDDLRVWKKLPDPVIAAPPAGLEVTGFRDPCLWHEGDKWMLILGSGIRGKGGAILLYSSTDLRHWTYLHPLIEGGASGKSTTNPVDTGDMWECPDFFPLGKKHVLLISTMGKVRWKVGTYADQRFTSEKEGVVDWGSYYAAKTMLDKNGNRVLWGWIPETRPDSELIKAGWAGVMSLPRTLSLTAQNELATIASGAGLGSTEHVLVGLGIHEIGPEPPKITQHRKDVFDSFRIRDLAAAIVLIIYSNGDEFTLRLESEDGTNFTTIAWKMKPPELRVNGIPIPLPGGNGAQRTKSGYVPFGSGRSIHLRFFVDGSVLELFANEGTSSVTTRVYQVPSGPLRLKVDGDAEVVFFEAGNVKPISANRLTASLCSGK
jgi:beta-fructofuranosidase